MKNAVILILCALLLSAAKPNNPATTLPLAVVTANTTLTASNHVVISTGTAITLTLPAASGNSGLVLVIANHGTGALTLSPAIKVGNTETLSGLTYNLGGNVITIISDGTDWRLIGQ